MGKLCWLHLLGVGLIVSGTSFGNAAAQLAADEPARVAGRTLQGWADDLASSDRTIRLRAVKSLGAFGAAAAEPLHDALAADDAGVRYTAAVHLGRIAGEPLAVAVERLGTLRSDGAHPGVQMAAAFALFRANQTADNLQLLTARLDYPERGMACSAADLLGMLGPAAEAAIPALEKTYAAHRPGGDGDYHIGGAAQNALRLIRDQP
jgi:HEAT repeat protein